MNQTTKIPNIDYTKTTSLDTYSGEKIWQSGYILRQVSEETNGIPVNTVIPIQIFFDPITGKVLDNILPPTLRKEYTSNVQPVQVPENPPQTPSINWGDLPTSNTEQNHPPQWGEQPQPQQPNQYPQWGEQPQPQQPNQYPQWGEQQEQQPQQSQPNNPQPISNWSWEQ
jgi:hypothetical protein